MGNTPMNFEPTLIPGAYIVGLRRHEYDRGFFARAWCQREFEAHGLAPSIAQVNISHSRERHTLRGLHFQAAPHEEDKLVRCVHGSAHFVLVDLRRDSPAYKRHIGVPLAAAAYGMLYVPKGCANGFLTLEDNTEILYLISQFHAPAAERGIRWNDPALRVTWPVAEPAVISGKDRSWPDFRG
jgi:dTDP-4-dehydrorhamnose 3,5-epimerase